MFEQTKTRMIPTATPVADDTLTHRVYRAQYGVERLRVSGLPLHVQVSDGTALTVRPVLPDDTPRLRALFARLSPESTSSRFLANCRELPYQQADGLINVDYQRQMALAATREQSGEEYIIAVARYWVIPGNEPGLAEPAIVVEDRYQDRGLGTLLSNRLVAYARAHGIRTFLAAYDCNNHRITRIIRRSGLPTKSKVELGICEIRVDLETGTDH